MNIEYELFNIMPEIKILDLLKENKKTKIQLAFNEDTKKTCILRTCKNRNLLDVYNKLAEIRHPNISVVYKCFYFNNDTYILEEYINGKSLDIILNEKGKFTEKQTAKIIYNICLGLECLHNYKPPIIHNDIKASNIIVCDDGNVKLFDFDISRTYKEGVYKNTKLMGTEEYAAPEHYGFGQSEPSTDVYSLGVTMHEMLTRKRLTPDHKVIYKGKLSKIIKKCIEIDTSKRYPNASELKHDLNKFLNHRKRNYIIATMIFCILSSLLIFTLIMTDDNTIIDRNIFKDKINTIDEINKTENGENIENKQENNNAKKSNKVQMVSKIEGELISVETLSNNRVIILEKIDGSYHLKTLDGDDIILDEISMMESYCKLYYNSFTDTMYLFQYLFSETNVYEVKENLKINLIANITIDFVPLINESLSGSFTSDGVMLCDAINKFIDTSNWSFYGRTPENAFIINDKIYQYNDIFDDNRYLIEIDSQGNTIKDYSSYKIMMDDEIYIAGNIAYFVGTKNDKDYVYSFDGNEIIPLICLNDYKYYSNFTFGDICVTNEAVYCYDRMEKTIKNSNTIKVYNMWTLKERLMIIINLQTFFLILLERKITMKNIILKKEIDQTIKKHIPYYFYNEEIREKIIDIICNSELSRREILSFAYSIGANISETNKLLEVSKYPILYVKRREDVIWMFMLKKHKDINFIINFIFTKNKEENR